MLEETRGGQGETLLLLCFLRDPLYVIITTVGILRDSVVHSLFTERVCLDGKRGEVSLPIFPAASSIPLSYRYR